jgi:hypothetical protein
MSGKVFDARLKILLAANRHELWLRIAQADKVPHTGIGGIRD